MKSRQSAWIAAMSFVASLVLPVQLAAQGQSEFKERKDVPPRYKLIDLGTLGGPQSNIQILIQSVTERGAVVGVADTSNSCPYNPAALVSLAFRWHNGVLTDLGALPSGCFSVPNWINARGEIVGLSENGVIDPLTGIPEYDAVLWRGGKITNLGTFGGNFGQANVIDNKGQIAGFALNTAPDPFLGPNGTYFGTQFRAFLWKNGVMLDLGTLGGTDSFAALLNQHDQIAGYSFTNSIVNPLTGVPTQHPFLWEDGAMLDLGSLGGTFGFPDALNNRGQVVGQMNIEGDLAAHPFLWDRGLLEDLGTFGGSLGEGNWLNDAGDVVGWASYPGDQVLHAALWKKGVMTDLGTVGGDVWSFAFAINSEGQIVGGSGAQFQFPPLSHAFLWENGHMIDLNTFVPRGSALQLAYAATINDHGEIAGNGVLPNGDMHAFVLIPCDDDHPGVEGCESADTPAVAPGAQARTTATQSNLTPSEVRDRVRVLLTKRNRGFRSLPPK
jgi:probable HAF family extracellular repeat protein